MPSPASLLAFESLFHAAAKGGLTAAGITPAYHARDITTDLPASRVVLEASGFARASGHMGTAQGGQLFYDHHRGQLTYIVTTPRTAAGALQHDAWLGAVRAFNLRARQSFAGLPYKILKLEESPSSLTYINEGERDRSELIYDLEFSIPGGLVDFAAT
jgi:hypothetical protein